MKLKIVEHAPLPLLNVGSVVNVQSHSALLVCSDGVKDVAVDATTNKVTYHINVTTDIATVLEDIVHEDGNKAVEFNIIVDILEGAVDEAVWKAMAENDDGHAAREEIVATVDDNVVEHVSHITTHR